MRDANAFQRNFFSTSFTWTHSPQVRKMEENEEKVAPACAACFKRREFGKDKGHPYEFILWTRLMTGAVMIVRPEVRHHSFFARPRSIN